MNALLRRGACPTLAAPMPTGDGLLIRLSPVSGGFSPKQLIGLCESAARHGNGIVEVTARGSCQFRGFSPASAERFAEDVDLLGIAVRTGVPVETSPLAGMDPEEIGDAVTVAGRIRKGIDAAGLTAKLGPKVSVVVNGGGRISLDDIAADVRLTADQRDGKVLWHFALAGDAETSTQLGWYDDNGVVEAATAVLLRIARQGRDARARDVAPDLIMNRPETANEAPLAAQASHSGFDTYRLHADRHALPISLPFGHIDATALITFARTAEALGVAEIRPAPARSLLPICPSLEAARALREQAAKLGFVTGPADMRRSIVACPGAPACASGKITARAIADEVARSLPPSAHDLSIHISGCEKGCARQSAADITIVGDENGAGLVVHGTTKSKPLAYRSADGLAEAIAVVATKLHPERRSSIAKAGDGTTTALSPVQTACLKAAFEQDGP
ncbi:precorrin-3B synthase [Mesorhizobium sp. IMUNJ 23232]|uniref:precorrin-3B synthase n=1 Tax=Mesorhizobium sp. IMUNJ 23232 TaxID=3376064 RepID=UPI00379C3B52